MFIDNKSVNNQPKQYVSHLCLNIEAVPYTKLCLCSQIPVPCSLLPIAFRLQVEEVGVGLVARHQVFVTAEFNNAPFRENHNSVSHTHG